MGSGSGVDTGGSGGGTLSVGEGGGRLACTGLEGGLWALSPPRRGLAEQYVGKASPSSSSSSSLEVSNLVSKDRELEGVDWNDEDCEELSEPERRSVCE